MRVRGEHEGQPSERLGGDVEDASQPRKVTKRRSRHPGASLDDSQSRVDTRPGTQVPVDLDRAALAGEQHATPSLPSQLERKRRGGTDRRVKLR
jgi:hypothetical protein